MHKKSIIVGVIFACVAGYLVLMLQSECFAATHYVVTNGTPGHTGPIDPYTNWAMAGTNIIDVVNAAMTNTAPRTVWVSNGTYYLTNQVSIAVAITLQSVNGRNLTIVDGNNYAGKSVTNRCFYFSTANDAILDGFTITNGYVENVGGGIKISYVRATIRNCIIKNNRAQNGGGVHISGSFGVLTNCIVCNNLASNSLANACGGGINISDGVSIIDSCFIYGNSVSNLTETDGGGVFGGSVKNSTISNNYAAYGGGIMQGGMISNCLVVNNSGSYGAGVHLLGSGAIYDSIVGYNNGVGCWVTGSGTVCNVLVISNNYGIRFYSNPTGSVQNCTVVWNGRGIYNDVTGRVENSIVYFNGNNFTNYSGPVTGIWANCCTIPSIGTACVANDPQFVDIAAGNYHLSANSPCVNTGTNQSWMTNAVDLAGRMRIRYGTVDMGAYETIYEGTIYRMGF